MSIVNFSIPAALDKQVNIAIKEKGFSSKAEFFRYLAIQFCNTPSQKNDTTVAELTAQISARISKQYGTKTLPSVRAQLKDLLDE